MTDDLPFWKAKSMQEMTRKEWESLCDGCAKCCLVKLEDEESGALAFTDIACDLLDCETCACGDYANRSVRVPDCVTLTPKNVDQLYWMPATCAYKLIAEGEDLPWWHPLVSGEQESVHQAGISARGRAIHESTIPVEDWESRIVHWPAVGFEGYYEPEDDIDPKTDEPSK